VYVALSLPSLSLSLSLSQTSTTGDIEPIDSRGMATFQWWNCISGTGNKYPLPFLSPSNAAIIYVFEKGHPASLYHYNVRLLRTRLILQQHFNTA
jgi:hypothetical protein